MNQSQISPETMAFLQQYGEDLPSAIAAAPDAELQQISPTYRELRQTMDEAAVKREMLSDQGEQQPASATEQEQPQQMQSPHRPLSEREQLLTVMLEMATLPDLQELLAAELAVESAVQEHLALASLAEAAGDVELAQQIADMLIDAVGQQGVADPPPETLPPDPSPAEPEAPTEPPPEAPAPAPAEPDAAVLADKLKTAWNAKTAKKRS